MFNDYTNIPLPQNWEQKYDINNKKFYFVDHDKQITTWSDPRIEIYKKREEEMKFQNQNVSYQKTLEGGGQQSPYAQPTSTRDRKASEIHQKFPKVALSRVTQLLEENYENVSSVESVLQREIQIANSLEQEEAKKKIDVAKKIEKEQSAKGIALPTTSQTSKQGEGKELKEFSNNEDRNKITVSESKTASKKESTIKKSVQESYINMKNDNIGKKIEDKSKLSKNSKKADIFSDKKPLQSNNLKNDINKTLVSEKTESNFVDEDVSQDSKLNKGPNKSISIGSDPKNRKGPNPDLPKGHNPENYCGPNTNLAIKSN